VARGRLSSAITGTSSWKVEATVAIHGADERLGSFTYLKP